MKTINELKEQMTKDKQQTPLNTPKKHVAYKYSNNQRDSLHEAIILGGSPTFVKYEDGQAKTVDKIESPGRITIPPTIEEYPYLPYEFADLNELNTYIERARNITTLDLPFSRSHSIVQGYIDQDSAITTHLSANIIWSYFQDRFPTTHYTNVVGGNETGKSSIGYVFEFTGYRPVRGTSMTAANYYRQLGTDEPGQCTIIEDEADHIDQDPIKMGFLKAGYEYPAKVPKINMNTSEQRPEWFCAYCYKMIIAERSLNPSLARGLLDRCFIYYCRPGIIRNRFSIKQVVINPYGNPEKVKLYQELMDFRKLMLCYRLTHYNQQLPLINTGLFNREEELCGPLLQLFQGTQASKNIEAAIEKFLEQRRQRKSNTIEAALYPIVVNLISEHGYEIHWSIIWKGLSKAIKGVYGNGNNAFQTEEYGTLFNNTLIQTMEDKFGATRKRKNDGMVLTFSKENLERYKSVYNISGNLEAIKEDVNKEVSNDAKSESEGSEGYEGSRVCGYIIE
jgi:hypothetical protein